MAAPGWVFSKEITSSPLRSMYPYPVSGFVGTIPKVTIYPFDAFQLLPELLFIQLHFIIII
jgi:hypothetical protein